MSAAAARAHAPAGFVPSGLAPTGPVARVAAKLSEHVERLCAFLAMVEVMVRPSAGSMQQLWQYSWSVLYRAVNEDQWQGAAVWAMWHLDRGLDPVMELARGVVMALRRATGDVVPGRRRKRTAKPGPEPDNLVLFARKMARIGGILRRRLLEEMAERAWVVDQTQPAADPDGPDIDLGEPVDLTAPKRPPPRRREPRDTSQPDPREAMSGDEQAVIARAMAQGP
ncbi:MAG: hypothetical protein U1E14_16675 [Geminicoccaceae bacterium]